MDYFLENEGIALITGATGTEKTVIVKELVRKLDDKIIYIQNNDLTMFEFYNYLGKMMDVHTNHCHMSQILMDLNSSTKRYGLLGRKIILIIDDVDTLDPKIIKILKYLYESNSEEYSGMKIILLGHSSFRDKCKRERYSGLIENITINYECTGLSVNETKEYIQHRISEAGGDSKMIDDRYYGSIYDYTQGSAQNINRYMSTLLLIMYKSNVSQVDNRILKMAQQEMEI
jgi:general secretion pathway protein A